MEGEAEMKTVKRLLKKLWRIVTNKPRYTVSMDVAYGDQSRMIVWDKDTGEMIEVLRP